MVNLLLLIFFIFYFNIKISTKVISIGAYIEDWGVSAPCDSEAFDKFQQLFGKLPAINMWYKNWAEPHASFPAECLNNGRNRGITEMITWMPSNGSEIDNTFSLKKIINGTFDDFIYQYAQAAKNWRYGYEMNGNWNSWGFGPGNPNGNTVSDFIQSWIHIHNIFTEVGAYNAIWVWCPNIISPISPLTPDMYPGDEYVDWVGIDGYNHGTTYSWSTWQSAAEIFGPTYDVITSITNKPIMIGEMGCAEAGGNKSQWLYQAYNEDIPNRTPRISAVVYFDQNKTIDWRINSSPSSTSTYKSIVAEPLFQGPGIPIINCNNTLTTPITTTTTTTTTTNNIKNNNLSNLGIKISIERTFYLIMIMIIIMKN